MSKVRKETFTCPACGQVNDFTMWESLNGDLDPEAKRQLLDGKLFDFTCCKCGYTGHVVYPTLYHDMTHQAMVYYVSEEDVEKTRAMLEDAQRTGFEMPGYRMRIVTDPNALREKAIIFEHGLDDRVVEIVKLFCLAMALEQFPDAEIKGQYFLVEEGKYRLEYLADAPMLVKVPKEVFDTVVSRYGDRLEAAGDKEYSIDFEWARRFLGK